ncbi:MAG TPA: hypothetical protein VMS74_14370 [Acidimicrobiia bacterium]|nr:hypothetical protein [Acidimicrobiia bacterium]
MTFWKVNLFPFLAWAPDGFLETFYASQLEFDHITIGDFSSHTIHYLAIAATHWSFMFGLAWQLRRPMNKVAPMWQATGGMAVVTLTYPFVDVSRIPPPVFAVIGLALLAGLLHPANLFRSPPRSWDRRMLTLGAIAAVPTVWLIVDQVGLQASGVEGDPHWQGLHYNFMGEYGLVLLLVLALGASALPGWRYSVWTGTFLTVLMGAGFITHPNVVSSQGALWGVTMVGFGLAWLALGERRYRRSADTAPLAYSG